MVCFSSFDAHIRVTSVMCCRYSGSCDYDSAYEKVKGAIFDGFYGPADKGVYSPSVQYTLYQMAKIAIQRYSCP